MIALLERPERLKAHVKWIAILAATCLIPVPLRSLAVAGNNKGRIKMFKRILVEYDRSPESGRAL